MSVSATDRVTIDDAGERYGLDGWGNGYLRIGDNGPLLVTPTRARPRATVVSRRSDNQVSHSIAIEVAF